MSKILSQAAGAKLPGRLKGTMLLPKCAMPIRPEVNPTKYQQLLSRCTDELYRRQSAELPHDRTFTLHDGPPYANGELHMGHALNKILKDIVNRVQLFSGRRISYVPGWDCHGLPIELKALQSLAPPSSKSKSKNAASEAAERGKSMDALEIRKLARDLATETVEAQKAGFRSWCVLGDWDHAYRTMNAEYELAQLDVFREMLKKGLIYRRFKPVYWSPSSGTALAEAELEYNEKHASKAAVVRFPLRGAQLPGCEGETVSAAIWTTTPWTIPANKAIAVHSKMEYSVVKTSDHGALLIASSQVPYVQELLGSELEILASGIEGKDLVGAQYAHPLLPEDAPSQPIISADFVTSDSGTGLVHCAPGHGMDDYLVCQEASIPPFSPVDDNGRFTADALPGSGLEGKDVIGGGTQAVLDLLTSANALLHLTPKFVHKYPYDWRTKRPVIVRATAQWFADSGGIKEAAVRALDNVTFIPPGGKARLESFVQGRSEWCISRQRAWGVPIPALYEAETGEPLLTEESVAHIIAVLREKGTDAWFSPSVPDELFIAPAYKASGQQYVRGKETMDVWFDSGTSWTQLPPSDNTTTTTSSSSSSSQPSAAPAPKADLYLEGSDQHRGWFQSSLLTSIAATGTPPFKSVLTHGFCLDAAGKKMSKSLGNVILPSDIILGAIPRPPISSSWGVDVLRLWVAYCDYTKDVVVGDKVLSHIHAVLRKMRVTTRFLLGNLDDWDCAAPTPYGDLTAIDKYALARLAAVNDAARTAYAAFAFNRVVTALTNYTIADLSAGYLATAKDRLYSDAPASASRRAAQTVCLRILQNYVALLAPVVPLLAEEVVEYAPPAVRELLRTDRWFVPDEEWRNERLVKDFGELEEVRAAVNRGIEDAKKAGMVKVNLETAVRLPATEVVERYREELAQWLIVSGVEVGVEGKEVEGKEVEGEKVGGKAEGEEGGWRYAYPIPGGEAVVVKAAGHKCVRCWVYTAPQPDGVCQRCESVVESLPQEAVEGVEGVEGAESARAA